MENNDGVKKKNFKKIYLVVAAILIIIAAIYILFFKPNPFFRINRNKLHAKESQKSSLTLDAPAEVDGVGKKFTLSVIVDSQGNFINAVQSYLTFDPKVLEITSAKTEQSFCKFYPENNYSNEKGTVRLACGAPYPGFKGTNTVQSIEFLTKAIKTTDIKSTPDSMVLANDGKGTNLLKEYNSITVKIKAAL